MSRKSVRKWGIITLAIVGVLFLGYWFTRGPRVDWDAVVVVNNKGIGLIEQFEYQAAANEFEKAVVLAPEWLPAQINLGIATFNLVEEVHLTKAIAIFEKVLKNDPKNRHAHYCLGVIFLHQNRTEDSYRHFKIVNELDPEDAFTWYHVATTHPDGITSPIAKTCLENALKFDPYLNAARYRLAFHPDVDEAQKKNLLADHKALIDAIAEDEYNIRYSELGKYAEVIGRTDAKAPPLGPMPMFRPFPNFKVELAEGARWATADDFKQRLPVNKLRLLVRENFGATMVLFDFNRDDKIDLLMLGAVVENGQVRNLLLQNEGNGRFRDVTKSADLAAPSTDLGCSIADLDADGFPDLVLTGTTQRVFRNQGDSTFADVSKTVGFDKIEGVCLGSLIFDFDQDGDLDVFVAEMAANLYTAIGKNIGDSRLRLMVNTSQAPIVERGKPVPPLKLAFQPHPDLLSLKLPDGDPQTRLLGLLASDLDDDHDIDILVLSSNIGPIPLINDRLGRFHSEPPLSGPTSSGLVMDANHDGEIDLFFPNGVNPSTGPRLLMRRSAPPLVELSKRFAPSMVNAPHLIQAHAVDVDQDGRTDVIGVEPSYQIVLLRQSEDGKLLPTPQPFGVVPTDLIAVACVDLDGDCQPDFLAWSDASGLIVQQNVGNGSRAVRLNLTGQRDNADHRRTNLDAIGARLTLQTGGLICGFENTTLSAGLGQSRLPITIGVGKVAQADVVRIRWPDQVPQAELNVATCELVRITETNRKPTSCPILFTWDGERYVFITDLLGGGALGEMGPDGSIRPARPAESIKIESYQLSAIDGKYLLKLAEPMDEVMYLDQVILEVIDLPPDAEVFPDERFVFADPLPTQELLRFRQFWQPRRATDHRQRNVLSLLGERDGKYVDRILRRSWLGYAEEHFVELDFGDAFAKTDAKEPLTLILTGGTDYPYPESMYAATQAGVELIGPTLERFTDGKWTPIADLGFPAGLPKTMTFDVTGMLVGPSCKLRIRTNMQIYWDQIRIGRREKDLGKVHTLQVQNATLRARGFAQEIMSPGSPLISYDDSRSEVVATSKWNGRLTKFGDVTPLLANEDDCFVLCGPGDEVQFSFDATKLPALTGDWKRSFVLRTAGYCKDHSPFTKTGGNVGPLPFRGMKSYPPTETTPTNQVEYDREWNTR